MDIHAIPMENNATQLEIHPNQKQMQCKGHANSFKSNEINANPMTVHTNPLKNACKCNANPMRTSAVQLEMFIAFSCTVHRLASKTSSHTHSLQDSSLS
jgi:hypothetical protein